ncbi:MAG TPA: YciI family protein [Miltoncostaeaceae bacterium]|nr:YciI family protein [Miltoncostaeaceae bacterium]
MFVLLARYTKPAEEVDRLLEDHKAWITRHQEGGRILMTARQVPLTGGLILARGGSADEMWEMIAEDPFHASGAAEYDVLEFEPARVTQGMEEALRP